MARYYYHITHKKWPKKIKLLPRTYGEHRCSDEPAISRICVSSTIQGCLIALGWCLEHAKCICIYRTKNKVIASKPRKITDAKITKEMWLVEPTKFIKYGKIITNKIPEGLFSMKVGSKSDLAEQKRMYKLLSRKRDWIKRI